MARKNASGAGEPQETPDAQPEQGLGDEISLDELASLLGDQADFQRSPTPAAPEPMAESLGDEISLEELAALQVAAGGKLGTPVTASAPAASQSTPSPPPVAPTPAPAMPPAPSPTPATQPGAFSPMAPLAEGENIDTSMSLLMDVPLRVSVELGRISMTLQQVLELGRGSIIELERLAGEPVDILVNDKLIGRGEVVVVDEYFGVKITELIEPKG
jgi:flagellar motor switch protein FliN